MAAHAIRRVVSYFAPPGRKTGPGFLNLHYWRIYFIKTKLYMHTKIWWSYVHIRYLVHVQKWTYLALGWPYGWALNFLSFVIIQTGLQGIMIIRSSYLYFILYVSTLVEICKYSTLGFSTVVKMPLLNCQAKLKVYNSKWTHSFPLDTVGTTGVVICNEKERTRKFQVCRTLHGIYAPDGCFINDGNFLTQENSVWKFSSAVAVWVVPLRS